MQLSDYHYDLPRELIAEYPAAERSQSRLLCLDVTSAKVEHRQFRQLVELLNPADLLVFNDTRVIPARLFGQKQSGGRVEVMIERLLPENRILAQIKASKPPKPGVVIRFDSNKTSHDSARSPATSPVCAEVLGKAGSFYQLQFPTDTKLPDLLQDIGHIPLPPYIKRSDQSVDADRYQTVYAREDGAVAAPTAGLHFDRSMLRAIQDKGVASAFITLHVGAGTYQPVRVENILEHKMHKELVVVSESVCDQIEACKVRGGRVIAIGTTTVRSLESAAAADGLKPFHGETDIFIYPGFQFRVVDAMISNFHLPESTLLMLVSAFGSKKMLLDAYQLAIAEEYRFFSYGDAMFLHKGLMHKNLMHEGLMNEGFDHARERKGGQ